MSYRHSHKLEQRTYTSEAIKSLVRSLSFQLRLATNGGVDSAISDINKAFEIAEPLEKLTMESEGYHYLKIASLHHGHKDAEMTKRAVSEAMVMFPLNVGFARAEKLLSAKGEK